MAKILLFVPLLAFLLLGLATALLPFAFEVPPPENPATPEELAGGEGEFLDLLGLSIYTKSAGAAETDDGTRLVLIHGFASSVETWDDLFPVFGDFGTAVGFDRPGFGLSERPLPDDDGTFALGFNPYAPETQLDLIDELADGSGDGVVLVGHSAGGGLALRYYYMRPSAVRAMILISPAVYQGGGTPEFVRPFLATPQMRKVGPALVGEFFGSGGSTFLESAFYSEETIPADIEETYYRPTRIVGWQRAFWEFVLASDTVDLVSDLDRVTVPVLVVTGDTDRIVPTEQSVQLAEDLPNADLVVLEMTGHNAQEERPREVAEAIRAFLSNVLSN